MKQEEEEEKATSSFVLELAISASPSLLLQVTQKSYLILLAPYLHSSSSTHCNFTPAFLEPRNFFFFFF